MKRKILSLLFIFSVFLLTGCGDVLGQITCEHDYEVVKEIKATCDKTGKIEYECGLCGKNKTEKTDKLEHRFVENSEVLATCTTEGYSIKSCKLCGYETKTDFVEPLGHEFGKWTTVLEPTDVEEGIKERYCQNCSEKEIEFISGNIYVDLTYIKEPFDSNIVYDCNDYNDLSFRFNCAVANLSETLKCKIYDLDDFNTLLNKLVADCDLPHSYSLSATLTGDELTLTFTYLGEPSLKTTENRYYQFNSLNYQPTKSNRKADFDDFNINQSKYEFKVTTSDMLYYALERGAKPIFTSECTASIIYEEMKDVLREIISDDMTDTQKVIAIYEWLVLNVTYDSDLLDLLYGGSSNLSKYNGFYLEGVFLDKKAVCEGISKAFTSMCNIEGIKCVSVKGYQTDNPTGAGHEWNKVYIDGNWYIVDATSGGTILSNNSEVLSYEFLLITEKEFSKYYTAEYYTELVCNKEIDVYSLLEYEFGGKKHDFVIESQEELNNIIKYLYSVKDEKITVSFFVDFQYGNSLNDELEKAFKANMIAASYSYLQNGNEIMIIRK